MMKPLLAACALFLLCVPAWHAQGENARLRAAYAECDITPKEMLPLWRYHGAPGPLPTASGTLDPLLAKVLIIASEQHRVALVSLDLGRPPEAKLMQRIMDNTGLPFVMLVATHTQNAPVLDAVLPVTPEDAQGQALKRYYGELEGLLVNAINDAQVRLEPVQLGSRTVQLSGIQQPEEPGGRRPADGACMIVKLETAAKTTLATWINFACHPDTRPSEDLRYSADFPGVLTAKVQSATGAPCLFLQGAAYRQYAAPPKDTVAPENATAAVGHEFAQQIIPAVQQLACVAARQPNLSYASGLVRTPARPNLSNPSVLLEVNNLLGPERAAAYLPRYKGNRIALTAATCLINDRLLLVGLSGEFTAQAASSIRLQHNTLDVAVLGYCNGYDFVFPGLHEVLPADDARPEHQAWAASDAAGGIVKSIREDITPNLARATIAPTLKRRPQHDSTEAVEP
ncbi:MAG: hypothetical protein HYV27_09645 [Candidatus Hydrogenedentes bacterium]|nr:hypothetical protein [Candidatus Hydrogenedentota bacterium]